MSEHSIAAIILAAGRSSRMGEPKALVSVRGVPFLARLIRAFRAAGCGRVVVVTGHDPEPVEEVARAEGAEVARNDAFEAGQLSSLQRGIEALSADGPALPDDKPAPPDDTAALPARDAAHLVHNSEGFAVAPVDHPVFDPEPLRAFLEASLSAAEPLAVPVHDGRRGHPLFARPSIAPEFLALDPAGPGTARTVIRRDPARVLEIPATYAGFFTNRNEPNEAADLEDFLPSD